MGRKSASGSGIRDEQPGSHFLELRNHFFGFLGVKILKFFDADPGSGMETVRIRDPGLKKSRIRDKHPGSATLYKTLQISYIFIIFDSLKDLNNFSKKRDKGLGLMKVSGKAVESCKMLGPRIREHIGSVIGGRVPATQGSSGPCVYCRKPGVRSLYAYVAS
jgi:hypothetical protein